MLSINVWTVLSILVVVLLIKYFGKRNAVWGGFTMGTIIGFIISLFYIFKGDGFIWTIIGKGSVIGSLAGFMTELLGKISNKEKK